MDATQKLSSFSCEIRVLEAKNIEFPSAKSLFVRYYLSAGNNYRIGLNTKRIVSTSDFIWNECFSLECLGTQDSIQSLRQATLVFELRRANTLPFVGRIVGSQLLGRAEIPWDQVFESPANMEIDKWVSLVSANNGFVDLEGSFFKQPKLKVGMRVRFAMENKRKMRSCRKWNNNNDEYDCYCGCKSQMGHCEDHHVFAIAAAMEFL